VVVPEWFASQLALEFGGRFQVRWSEARSGFIIDERVARGHFMPSNRLALKLDALRRAGKSAEASEFLYRLQHGTVPFLEIHPSGRTTCPSCLVPVPLKPFVWEFAHCPGCQKDFPAVSCELGPAVLERLRYLDAERGGLERILADMDAQNDALVSGQEKAARADLEASIRDEWPRLVGIPSVGWTPPAKETPQCHS
jgi:hypothetical protein